jgi:hypothetical protein
LELSTQINFSQTLNFLKTDKLLCLRSYRTLVVRGALLQQVLLRSSSGSITGNSTVTAEPTASVHDVG